MAERLRREEAHLASERRKSKDVESPGLCAAVEIETPRCLPDVAGIHVFESLWQSISSPTKLFKHLLHKLEGNEEEEEDNNETQ